MSAVMLHARGLASQKHLGTWTVENPQENLMEFLRRHGIPVASSCGGDGVCRKCVVNGDQLSCQLSIGNFLKLVPDATVTLSYL